ncbi:biliverdin-producing heme oxygenase [Paucibacter sp. KBW04]|uniref:biliverdin-producing heme oxygenase n=1 Tax=Paucibacter sp. KBW04 TaxID=2153361 RepID=UPI000F564E9F|nr:biliverdin-producing heme oxygenase [Paucibacter sp. KBW04]RQO60477.1 biliverdin-producing heme oxygenase [Paucibacter sp. KBW04]
MTSTIDRPVATAFSHSQALKAASHGTHERLDQRIMRAQPFASLANYQRFLQVQLRFHQDISPLYQHAELGRLLPDLGQRQRLQEIRQDLIDLGHPATLPSASPWLRATEPLPVALGWFYVAEGSNLGAAVLFKLAVKLGLDAGHGARHLAGHPEGRMRHWRGFTGMLDGLALSPAEQALMQASARAAFERVHGHVAELL